MCEPAGQKNELIKCMGPNAAAQTGFCWASSNNACVKCVQAAQRWWSASTALPGHGHLGRMRSRSEHCTSHCCACPCCSYTPQYDIIARGYARRRRKEAEHEASLAAAKAAAAAAALASDDMLRMQMELDAMLAQQNAKGDAAPEPGGCTGRYAAVFCHLRIRPLVLMS